MQSIVVSDCLIHMKSMDSDSVDVVCTSPPYNIGLTYSSYKDDKTPEEYLDWIHSISSEIKRILKPQGSFFLNVGGTNVNPHIPNDILTKIKDLFVLQNHIIWVKSITVQKEVFGEEDEVTSHGHFKPINSKRYVNNLFEDIFHFTKSGAVELDRLAIGVPYQDKSNIDRWKGTEGKDKRCRGNVWFIPYRTVKSKKEKFNHPAGFPEQLVENCIRLHGVSDNMVVLDPFLGAGTTLAVCQKLNIDGIGVEMDENYAKISQERLLTIEGTK